MKSKPARQDPAASATYAFFASPVAAATSAKAAPPQKAAGPTAANAKPKARNQPTTSPGETPNI